MRGIEQRLERLEEALGDNRCVCGDRSPMRACEILIVEDGWDEERIRLAEESKRLVCPIHGQTIPILRLSGSDVYG